MKTSIVILTFNQLDYTKQCIDSIRQYTRLDTYELIIVDNFSTDGTRQWLLEQNDIKPILNDENLGFPKGCNQGIEVSTGDAVLLLNNDTVVTANWLDNLTQCLFSDDSIGAIGPITNSASYLQSIVTSYKTLDEMHQFARETNRPNPALWEPRLKLVGFCILIRRSVIDQVGLLDERFTPGNYEDDDYSLRIIEAGYRLLLCRDTFIHHYGSVSFKEDVANYVQLNRSNHAKFAEKWSFSSEKALFIDQPLLNEVGAEDIESPSILHIQAGCGASLLMLQSKLPQAALYGMEENERARRIAARSFVMFASLDDSEIPAESFDYVLITGLYGMEPEWLYKTQRLLKPYGKLVIVMSNGLYYTSLRSALNGHVQLKDLQSPDAWFSRLEENGYHRIRLTGSERVDTADKTLVDSLAAWVDPSRASYLTVPVLTTVSVKRDTFNRVSRLVGNDHQSEEYQELAGRLDTGMLSILFEAVSVYPDRTVEALSRLGAACWEAGNTDVVIPILQHALTLNPDDRDCLFNLGVILYACGDLQAAASYLEPIEAGDPDVQDLMNKIREQLDPYYHERKTLKFLLRRVEHNIDKEKSLDQLSTNLWQTSYFQVIKETIDKQIIGREQVWNEIAVSCYLRGDFDQVIPCLQEAYKINPHDISTLYNLAFILKEAGEYQSAIFYINNMYQLDEPSAQLKREIEERRALSTPRNMNRGR